MNIKLSDVYKIIRAEYPNKVVLYDLEKKITETTQKREGTVGNSWAFELVFDETEANISIIDLTIQFRCEAVQRQ